MPLQCWKINLTKLDNKNKEYLVGRPTFISAFESSPVHCLNPRPSGNRRKPANGGTMLMLLFWFSSVLLIDRNKIPVIDVIKNPVGLSVPMSENKIFFHPGYKMIFKSPFNDLMKEVRSDELMYVSAGEIVCKGLKKLISFTYNEMTCVVSLLRQKQYHVHSTRLRHPRSLSRLRFLL